jgi:diacylglycerol kinase
MSKIPAPARSATPPASRTPNQIANQIANQIDGAPAAVEFVRPRGFWAGRWFSLRAAVAGVVHTLRTQPNAWIELAALVVVVVAGIWLRISALEWGLVGFTVALVLALEAVNTAVEAVVDLVSPQYHPLAKIAKDAAAGAMVLAVLGSLVVAVSIFGPRLWALFF